MATTPILLELSMTWIIMPVMAAPELTEAAISDCLAQSVPTRLLIINQGIESDFRLRLERIAEENADRVFIWSHDPPLPSLAASWNRALDFVWETGGAEALVVNNDVRLDPRTYSILQAVLTWPKLENLFVTAVGVTEEQFNARPDPLFTEPPDDTIPGIQKHYDNLPKGGPDFSCYMISRVCHEKYRFDEAFIPAYCEDLDFHRRLMLGGDGSKIFSVNLPYLHFAAGTLKTIDSKKKVVIEARIVSGSRAYYEKKWGGPVNQETFQVPFGEDGFTFTDGSKTTPALQEAERAAARGLVPPKPEPLIDDRQSSVIRSFGQWVVTKYGIECSTTYYPIEKSRLLDGDTWDASWEKHLSEKNWVDIASFRAAYAFALDYFKLRKS
jgi:hypothetical protein